MIRTIDFNAFVAGTVIDDEYVVSDGVTVSAVARGDGADQAMIFDSNNPTGDDTDLASDTLDGLLIISEDGDSSDPDDNDAGGSIFFDFEDLVRIKSLTFKDIEETSGEGTRMIFYNADGEVIENQFVAPTGDGGETTVQLFVPGTARMEVRFEGSGAIDNLVFDDGKGADEAPTAVDDSAITDEDTSVIIDLRGNDNDPNNTLEELTIGEFVSPNGTVEDNGDGTVTFTPDQDFNGEAVFTYTLRDPNGNTDVGEVTVQVNPINDAPDAVADADTTDFNTAITVDLLANDTDPDIATNGDVLTVVAVSVPEAQGTVVNNGDGTATFTPADGYTGVATIAYTIEDEAGLRDSDEHFVTVEVDDNQPPVTGDDTLTTDEDTPSEPLNVLANDSDPDGDTLTLVSAESPDGEVSIDPDGEIVFTPTEDFNGETTITYTVTDPSGAESTGTVNVTVNPINDAPDAVDDSDTTEFETAVTVDLLANDTDVDIATNGDVITVIEATVPAEQGILVDNGDGTVTFTPADGFSGDATISYTIEDAAGLQDSALHTVTVGESTDVSPVAVDDVAETQEDTAVVIDLLGNDTDPDTPAEDLTISALSVPADQGEVVDNGDGTVTFTPAPDFNGEVTISYTVSDPEGNTDDGEAVVTVTPVADAPVTEPDALTTDEDTPSEPLNVLANDSDPDGDELTLISATSPDGEVSFDPNGEIVFTPNENFNGTTTIEYFVTDPSGLESPGIVNVTVNPVNDAPDAVDDTDVTDEDTSVEINLLANDTDVESDPLTVTTASVPAEEGTLEPVTDGSDGLYIFTPAPDFNGDATVSYSISDGNGGEDSAVHVITVGEENDAPVANPDTLTTDEDTPSEPLNVLANDSDPDGDPLTLTSATSPDGEVSFDPDGEIVFTPDENFNGETTITYIVTDPSGTESTGTVTVTVNPVNDAPDAVDDTDVTDEDTSVEINLLANDTDVEGDPLTVTTASVPAEEGTLEPVTDGSDGLYTFTPAPDFNGDATVSYTISDGNGGEDSAVHVITVGEENDAPVANPDTLTTDEDTPSEPLNVLANDTDPDGDPLELIEATSPDGTVAFTPEGEVIFTPDPDFNGETTITYTVTDPSGEETEGTVTVTVTPVNDAPDAVDDVDVTPEDTPITVDLLANDTDVDGDDLTVVEATVPEEQGTLVDNGDGTVTFTPAEDFTGEATISYTIEDGNGGSDSAEHTVYVNEVSDAPVANDDVAETPEDTPVTIDALANDTDPDGDDTLFISDASVPEEQGTVEIVDGQLVFTPAPDFNGDATITYTAEDPDGNESDATVTVTVTPVNDAPVAEDDSDVTDIDTPVTVDLLANDSDADEDPLTVIEATVPAEQGTLVDNGDGTVTFTPADDFLGEATISYTISDPSGEEASAVHTITVNDPAGAPTAEDDSADTPEDTPVTIDVVANDTDPQGDPLTVTEASVPEEQGTVEIVDNQLVFTPAPDFNGPVEISYTVEDPDGNAAEGTATVEVTPVNDAPVAEDDEDVTDFNTPVTVDLLANDTDVDGDDLTVIEATVPAEQGTLVDNGDGTVTFTPADGFEGEAVISYTIEDEEGLTDSAVHVITVGDNVAPVAVDDTAETPEDTAVIVDLIGNDTDENGDPLTLVEATVPEEQGTLEDNGDGTVTFTPAPDFTGPATITYTVADPAGLTDEGEAVVDVTPVNDAPVAVDDSDVTDFETPVTVDLLANDSDVDGDDLTLIEATVPAEQGTLVDNGDGTVTFTPADDFLGEATISYTISDPSGEEASAVHVITVNDTDNAPEAVDDVAETDEDTPVTIDAVANDTDPNGDPLTITEASVPEEQGTVDIVDNQLVFTPAEDFTGEAEISYTVEDPDGNADEGTVTVTVNPVNDAPDAVDDVATTEEDTPVVLDLIDNDSDPEDDLLTVTEVSVPEEQGTVVNNGDGTATFTPAPDFVGEATVTYTIADPDGEEDTAVHVVDVTPINDAPDAVDDADVTDEDTPVTVDLLANDTDVDGDDLRVVEATVPEEEGTLVDNGDGTVTFTPAPDFNGDATITYTISDGNGGEDTAEHVITVGEENDAPVTEPDTLETDEDTPSEPLNVLANDTDPDGDPLELIEATSPDGTVAFTPEGEVIFTPDPDFNGETTITYTVTDPSGEETEGTVTVTVNPVNDAPDAVDDVDVTPEDTPITVDLLANDTDVDGDDLTVVEATVPEEQGTLVDNGDGTVTFTPAEDFTGEATISYTIEDGNGGSDSAEHTVYVNEVSDAPVANDDVAETPEDTPVTIDALANDTDPDGDDTLFISDASVPEEQGTVEIVDGQLVFTPAPDFNGDATITYTAEDPDGNESDATVTVTVTPVNDAPVAEDDSDVTDINTPVTVDLLANDSDADEDPLTVIEATVPAEQGTLVDNGDGTVTFTPADDFLGEATISYTISDPSGEEASAVHTITVNDPAGAPTAEDDIADTPEDTPVTIDVVANDTDPQGDPLTVTEASVPEEQGTVEIVDNQLVFTPAPDFNGPVEISYTVEDPDGNAAEGTATVEVTPVNDAPVAEDDEDVTDFNTPVTVDLLANDTDVDGDDLTVIEATIPEEQGTLVDNGDGTVTFTPADGFEGEAVISYTIEDEEGLTDSAVHVITVGDNVAPVAVDDTAETPEDTAVVVDLIGNDRDENGDPLTLVEATVPEEQGTLEDNGDGTVTFTPAPDFTGPATITYTVADPAGLTDEGEAVVDVTPVNDAPVAVDDSDVTDFETPVTVDLLANDSDVDGDDLTVIEATVPAEQGTLVDNGDGTVTFTPADDFLGEATISYTISDPSGEEASAVHVITVNDTDNAPEAVDDVAETDEDTPVTIDAAANDTDPNGDPLTITEASVPEEQGTVDIVDNQLVFTPAEDFTGEAEISYTVEDPDGNADEGTVTVTVNPVNDAPDAVDDVATTEEDTPVVLDLIDNDSDPEDDLLTVTEVSVPEEQGTVVNNGDGTATFTPAPDFVGEATVTYTIADPDGEEDTAVHVVDVTPINDAPDAVDDADVTDEDTPVTVDLLANDTDVDGDDLRVVEATVPEEEGTLVDNGDGTVTFTPAPDFNGDATITYTISDGNGGEDTAEHVITVGEENDAPVTEPDTLETDEDTPSEPLNVLANDTDPDGDPLELIEATSPDGTVAFTPEGEVIFTPDPDFNGETTITYTVTDPSGEETEGTVTVTVNPVNDAPDAVDDVDVTPEDTPITVDLLANDTDVDGDDLTVVEATVPEEQGTLVDNGDGTVTFTPAEDFTGEATISYTIEDEEGLTDSAEHLVYVNEVSDVPVANDDIATTEEDTPVTIDALENDTDPDGDDTLIILEATVPEEQGTVEIVDNELVFTPAPDFNGEAIIDYVAQDPDGNEAPAQVTVTVDPVNDAPVAEDDSDITDLNTPVTVDLLANDSDVDGDDLTVIEATVPEEQGTLVENGDGTVTFTPSTDFTGEATISYTIEDEEGLTDDAVHVITVNDTENAPTAVDDTAETDEDTPVTIDVLENDTDPTDDPLTITEASVPEEQGTVEIVDNQLVFTPAPDFNGPAEISYTVEDPDGNADEGTVAVTVNPVNDAPVAEDDEDVTDINTPVTVDLLANDSDVDGDDLTVIEATVPAEEGTLVDNGDGTVTFTPATDFVGEATISYTIEDEEGLTDDAVHVITVEDPENTPPVAVDDVEETPEDTPVIVDLIGNDTDEDGDPLTLVEATVPEEQGTLEDNGDGTVTFTPAPDFNGPATITYTVADPDGEEDEGEAIVTVTPVNDAPVAEDDRDITDFETPVTVDLLANDSDVDGDDLTVIEATVPAEQGTLVDNGDGTVTFTPADDFTGDATISYTIEDEEGLTDEAVHVITVNDTDNAPTAVDDAAETDEETPVTIDVLDNDTDPTDDPLTVVEATVPEEQGTVEIVDNQIVFTPAEDFTGEATIDYIIEDPDGNADEAVVTVTVNPVNDAPDAVDDVATTEEDTPVVLDLIDNDSDPEGDPLTVTEVSVPEEQGTVVNNGDGTATFTPAPDFVGEATVTYTIADPDGEEDTAVHVVDVTPVNDAPDAVDDADTTDYNTPVTVDLLANDTDIDGDELTVIEATVPEEQGTLVDNGDGTVTFTPVPGFIGDATITYTIEDEGGLRDSAEHVITVEEPGDRDGIVEGTDGSDLIDPEYAGDPDGDFVDNEDAILPGQEPNDDIIIAGDGDDTVLAGLGDDSVTGGEGNDSILGEDGSDTVDGGDGDDVIDTSGPDLAPDDGYPFEPGTDDLGYEPDTDPENDRDSVIGGAGNDTITTGDDSDTISGGDGDDVINAGIDDDLVAGDDGDDRIVGGEGDDTITGGFGNDTIYGGTDPDVIPDLVNIVDEPSDDDPFSPDRNPDNGRDLIDGGAGDDLIFGDDDDDTITGGSGNDTIDGGIDDDTIDGGTGDDSLIGGQGNDTLRGNRNDDTLIGGTGDDVLDGGGENDLLEGGDGDDDMMGGQGDDTLRGGDGDDTMTGGAGQDVFEDVGPGDVIDGGSGPVDMDTLDLTGSKPEGGSFDIVFTSDDEEDGVVNYFDADGEDAGQLVFEEIETIIPCFTPGTKIATPKGERLVEELKVGDRVITRDNGIQEIRWVGARDMTGAEFEKAAHLKPVLIRQGALGNDLPERDMMVSPNHRVLVANDKTALYFEEREVLVAAKHLTGLEGVDIVDVSHTTYIHVMFDQHEVILSDGSWTESFQPGDMSLAGIGNAQRQEILELFPELATQEGVEAYASARRSLKKHEAKLITK